MAEITVEMLARMSGRRNGKPWPDVGGTITLPEAEAEQYIKQGICKLVAKKTKPAETATAAPVGEKRATKKATKS